MCLFRRRASTEPNDLVDTDGNNIKGEVVSFNVVGQVAVRLIYTTEIIKIAALAKRITTCIQQRMSKDESSRFYL